MNDSPRLSGPVRHGAWALSAFILLAAAAAPSARAAAAEKAITYEHDIVPLLQTYCYECHGDGEHKGDITLDREHTLAEVRESARKWELVMDRVRAEEMPPDDAGDFPTDEERARLTGWIEREVFHVDPEHPDPGRVTIHRLNRAEYNNTIRDLTGVDFQPADDFPADNSGYGFDNISDVLSLSPVLLEKYLAAARRIVDEALPTEIPRSQVRRFRANLMEVGFNADGDRGDGYMPLGSLEEDNLAVTLPLAGGDYLLRVHAFATPKGKYASSDQPLSEKPIVLTCMVDTSVLGEWAIAAPEDAPQDYEMRVSLPPGKHRLAVVNRHVRGGENEFSMRNGRPGPLQGGTVWVKTVELEGPLPTATVRFAADQLEAGSDDVHLTPDGARLLARAGEVACTYDVPAAGEYLLRASAYSEQAGPEPARMEFRIDGKPVHTFDVRAPGRVIPFGRQRVFSPVLLEPAPQVYEFRTTLPPGEHRFAAAFVNDFADPENENPNLRDRNLFVTHLELASLSEPARLPDPTPMMQQLLARAATPPAPGFWARWFGRQPAPPAPEVQAQTVVGEFARRAWRRPVTPAEVDELMGLYRAAIAEGQPSPAGIKLALQAVLVSPYFLFRGEVPTTPMVVATNDAPVHAQPVDEYALASRLSYFLWSSMPDDELFDLAAQGALRRNLDAQVRRMLASPKAQALVSNFAGQWLEIRNLKFVAPDRKLFPDFDEELRTAMQGETEAFFAGILQEDRSVLEFLTADYTYVNERLARHYGIPGVRGPAFVRVSLADTPRRGVLTQASVLTITSNPTRTSPVKRGKWVLEDLLGTPPPPPPPNVPDLPNDGQPVNGTLRHQMEAHRVNPTCASCHARMDPIGFGLENFDAIGAYRTQDGEFPVDAAGQLTTGETFASAADLTALLANQRRDQYLRNLAEKMLTYALGRGIERTDRPAVEQITQAIAADGYRFSALVRAIVKSVPFDQQRAEDTTAVAAR